MISVRRSEERGRFDFGWLDTRHTFSFGRYYDEQWVGFGALCVFNEDRVQPGRGFDTHAHRDMEIISYVLSGALEHKDSLGTHGVIRPGDVQRMSAGRGVMHSEFNASRTEPVHFLQIWIEPSERGIEPSYEQNAFAAAGRHNTLRLFVAPAAEAKGSGAVTIHQDARLLDAVLDSGASVRHAIGPGRRAWAQVLSGSVRLNGHELRAGDGAGFAEEATIGIEATSPGEVLVIDLPAEAAAGAGR